MRGELLDEMLGRSDIRVDNLSAPRAAGEDPRVPGQGSHPVCVAPHQPQPPEGGGVPEGQVAVRHPDGEVFPAVLHPVDRGDVVPGTVELDQLFDRTIF